MTHDSAHMPYQTIMLCVEEELLVHIRSWCEIQFDSESWYIHDKGEFILLPVIQIEFLHAHDLMQFELTWNNLF